MRKNVHDHGNQFSSSQTVHIIIFSLLMWGLVACSNGPAAPESVADAPSETVVLETAEAVVETATDLPPTEVPQPIVNEAQESVEPDVDEAHAHDHEDEPVDPEDHGHEHESAEAGAEETHLHSDYLNAYTISDTGFGTEVIVTIDEGTNTRTIASNTLPNHETGEFPNPGNPNTISAQDQTWTYPLAGTFVGTAAFARTPGVGINGVKFEPDTAERAICDTGEVHNIEAIQDVTDLGLDFNNAHVQPTGEYHYHGVSQLLVELYATDDDLVHVGFAADGFLIYYSKSDAFEPSYQLGTGDRAGTNCVYTNPPGDVTIEFGPVKDGSLKSDWDYDPSYGVLDECNGTTIDGTYVYLITDAYPYVPRCLMGEFSGAGGPGQGGGGQERGGPPEGGGPPPGGGGGRGGEGGGPGGGGPGGGGQGGEGGAP